MDTLTAWPRCRSRYLILLFAVALTVRIAFNLSVVGVAPDPNIIDTDGYSKVAWNLATAGEYAYEVGQPTSYVSPLFPIMMAGVFVIAGFNLLVIRLALSVIGALTCIVVYSLGREISGEATGRLAGWLAVFYPFLFFYNAFILSETIFLFLLSLFTLLVFRIQRVPRQRTIFLAGLILGMCGLTRPVLFPFLALVAVWALWFWRDQWRRGLSIALAIVAVSVTVVSPWMARNYRLWGRFVPGTTVTGIALIGGNNLAIFDDPARVGEWIRARDFLPPKQYEQLMRMSESDRDRWATLEAVAFMRHHMWDEMPRATLYKLGRFWILPPVVERTGRLRILWALFYLPVLGLATGGMIATRHLRRDLLMVYLQFIYFTAVTAVFYGSFRMRAPLEPYLVVFAAVGLLAYAGPRSPVVRSFVRSL